jgi:hypothetical protein
VFQTTVKADENTDLEVAVGDLRARCETAGITAPVTEMLIAQLREILPPLVTHGKMLTAQGSQLAVSRDIGVDGHNVKVVFGAGIPRPGWRKLLDKLLGA